MFRADALCKMRLVPRRQRLAFLEGRLSLAGQKKSVRPSVAGRVAPFGQAAALEPMEQAGKARSFDAERVRQIRLGKAGISADHNQNGILCRPDTDRGQRTDEILENPDLQTADEIPEVAVQNAEIDCWPCRRMFARAKDTARR